MRSTFERFGEIRDVYLPRDYYTQRPKGFGFIEFRDTRDAEDALYQMDRSMMGGREITVVLSKESRKSPREMLKREDTYGGGTGRDGSRDGGRDGGRGYGGGSYGGGSGSYGGDRRRRSRSPVTRGRSPRRREGSYERRNSRERSYSRSRSRSPDRVDRSPPRKKRSPSVADEPERVRDKPQERERFVEKERSRSPVKRDDYSD